MADTTHRTDPAEAAFDAHGLLVPVLAVIEPASAGSIIVVTEPCMLIGRDPECDVFLDDAKCSRQHVRVNRRPRFGATARLQVALVDLGSTNGTWVNGRRIEDVRVLAANDRVRIGHTTLVYSLRDTAEIETQRAIARLATTDPLTGLANRRAFAQCLHREFLRAERYGWPLSLIMVDIDHFKHFNDTHGHDTGDRVLAAVAAVVTECVRTHDLACRHGGEEFVVLLPQAGVPEAMDVAVRVHTEIARMLVPGCKGVTASLGVATLGDEHDSPESLLECADQAMYVAKRSGRNRVCR